LLRFIVRLHGPEARPLRHLNAAGDPRPRVKLEPCHRWPGDAAKAVKNWLVVANAARARVLEVTDRPGVLGRLLASLGDAARATVLRTVPADYTALHENELASRMAAS